MSKERDAFFRKAYEKLTEIDKRLKKGSITEKESKEEKAAVDQRFRIGRNMVFEKYYIEWRLKNTDCTTEESKALEARLDELEDIDVERPEMVGIEVEVDNKGVACIVGNKGDYITVEFYESAERRSYKLSLALERGVIKFCDGYDPAEEEREEEERELIDLDDEDFFVGPICSLEGKTVTGPDGKPTTVREASPKPEKPEQQETDELFGESFAKFVDLIRMARRRGMISELYGAVPVIRCDEDDTFNSMLEELSEQIYSKNEVVCYPLVSGVRRYDSSVDMMMKGIARTSCRVFCIDVTAFSSADPIFNEVLENVMKWLIKNKTLYCFRVRESDCATAGIIAGKIPVFELRSKEMSHRDWAEILYRMIPANKPEAMTEKTGEILCDIIRAERMSGKWAGKKTVGVIALEITNFAEKNSTCKDGEGKLSVTPGLLKKYYKEKYESSEKAPALVKLRKMIGMGDIADLAEMLIAKAYQDELLRKNGIEPELESRHIVFNGPSGCGKTTAARLLSAALTEAGLNAGVYECNARQLCGQYLGETRVLTQAAVESTGDGILFIDEAYALSIGDEYGKEAIAVLLSAMENPASKLTIIFAGYKDEMKAFLDSNPGLNSRVGYIVGFEPYTTEQLFDIAMSFLKNFKVESEAEAALREHFLGLPESEVAGPNFGLARYSRNIASAVKSASARRHWLSHDGGLDITAEDVETALRQRTSPESHTQIGFSA